MNFPEIVFFYCEQVCLVQKSSQKGSNPSCLVLHAQPQKRCPLVTTSYPTTGCKATQGCTTKTTTTTTKHNADLDNGGDPGL